MHPRIQLAGSFLVGVGLLGHVRGQETEPKPATAARPQDQRKERPAARAQPRPSGTRVKIDPATIEIDDGDSIVIAVKDQEPETVRILGIDTPETRHIEHNIPFDQERGPEAKAFARGAFATATDVELLRASTLDPYGRTLGYLFINGKNYSILAIRAQLAAESITPFGDNGFPEIAREVLAAAKAAGPPPFEPPHLYRNRMRTLSNWLKQNNRYPKD